MPSLQFFDVLKVYYSYSHLFSPLLLHFTLMLNATSPSFPLLTTLPCKGQVGEHVLDCDYIYLHIFHCAVVQLVL